MQVQSQATNPSTVQADRDRRVDDRAASRATPACAPGQLRGHISTQAVSGNISRLGQNPLVAITVTGHARRPVARAANDLARTVVFSDALASYSKTKIANLQLQVDQEKATLSTLNTNLKAQQAALKDGSGLSTSERLIALGQLNGLQAQLLDDHRPAHDEPAAARARQGRRGAGDHDPRRGDEDHRPQPPQHGAGRGADRPDPRPRRRAALRARRSGPSAATRSVQACSTESGCRSSSPRTTRRS